MKKEEVKVVLANDFKYLIDSRMADEMIILMLTHCKNDYTSTMQQIYSRGNPLFHRRLETI